MMGIGSIAGSSFDEIAAANFLIEAREGNGGRSHLIAKSKRFE